MLRFSRAEEYKSLEVFIKWLEKTEVSWGYFSGPEGVISPMVYAPWY
jgi:hypothetical protein